MRESAILDSLASLSSLRSVADYLLRRPAHLFAIPFPLAGVLTLSLCTNMVVATPYRLAAPVAKAENDPAFGANEGLQRVRTAVGEVLQKEEVANHQEVRSSEAVFRPLRVVPRQLFRLSLR